MTIEIAQGLLIAISAYLGLGVGFAFPFVTIGLVHLDSAAAGMPWTARILLLPGAILLWPVLLTKWLKAEQRPAT
jgi:hypothetical protein